MTDPDRCRELLEKLSAWLDGDLDPENCADLEGHLRSCARCRACREILSASITLCGRREELSGGARARMLARIRRELGGD